MQCQARIALDGVARSRYHSPEGAKAAAEDALAKNRLRFLEAWTPPPGYRLH
jgi:hypothetical protein